MISKHHRALGAFVIGAALIGVGCADGQRQNKGGNNRRVLRNPNFPSTTTPMPINQKVATNGQPANAPGAPTAPTAPKGEVATPSASADEAQINARFYQLTKTQGEVAKVPAGQYDLAGITSHAQITTVAKGFATALVESPVTEQGPQAGKVLSSGSLENAEEPRTLQFPAALDVKADGVAAAPAGAEYVIESKVEPAAGKPTIVQQMLDASTFASFSITKLLAAPNHSLKDAGGKLGTLRILPQADGSVVLWLAVEERPMDQAGKQSNAFYRNFFFTFEKAAPEGTTPAPVTN